MRTWKGKHVSDGIFLPTEQDGTGAAAMKLNNLFKPDLDYAQSIRALLWENTRHQQTNGAGHTACEKGKLEKLPQMAHWTMFVSFLFKKNYSFY